MAVTDPETHESLEPFEQEAEPDSDFPITHLPILKKDQLPMVYSQLPIHTADA